MIRRAAAVAPLTGLIARRLRPQLRAVPAMGWALIATACAAAEAVAWLIEPWPASAIYGIVLLLLIAAAAIDAREQRLPDALTITAGMAGLVGLTVYSWATGLGSPWRALCGAAIFAGWILLGALIVHDGYGLGDVKLAAALGALLGWQSWVALAVGILISQVLVSGALLICWLRHRDRVALGPAFVIGALASLALQLSAH